MEDRVGEEEHEPDFTVEVSGGKTRVVYSMLRAILALPILLVSLVLYLAGILFTVTIIGALVGIPLIAATYGIDMLALVVLINLRGKLHSVTCPKCSRKRLAVYSIKDRFVCKGCGSFIILKEV
ncbi:MAG: hypothetical protein RQ824_10335 [bacterium]|nr:hypothetical protein [bacterium]